jgi:hypothetical protein
VPAGDLRQLVPVLTARELAPSVSFWERLGFEVRSDYGGEYITMVAADDPDGIEVHLSQWDDHDPHSTAGVLYLRVADAAVLYERLHAELEAEGLLYLAPASGLTEDLTREVRALEDAGTPYIRLHVIEDKPWGQRQFGIIDPAGWLVHVGSPVP